MPVTYTGTQPDAYHYAPDYAGSYDEWEEQTIAGMVENYLNGVGQTSGFLDPSLGAPNEADFGSSRGGATTAHASQATINFFRNYVKKFGRTDPWIQQHFGTPPDRAATWQQDVETPAETAARDRAQQDADRQAQIDIARGHDAAGIQQAQIGADAQIRSTQMRVGADLQIAGMEDATRRYIAEGDWGTQRYVAELQDKGQDRRLALELGFRREELAQRAVEEKQRAHEAMLGLTLEVAKYDAELGSQPRNWLKYAAWLQNRGQVVNGLTLATAAQTIPESAIPGSAVAGSGVPGAGIAVAQAATQAAAGQYQVGQYDLSSQDYAGLANQLMGGPQTPPTTADLMAASRTLATGENAAALTPPSQQPQAISPMSPEAALSAPVAGGGPSGVASFAAYGGPTTNKLGMTVQPSGQKEDYRQWSRLQPSQQEMRIGEVESIGRWNPDFLKELEMSRPKGNAVGAAGWG